MKSIQSLLIAVFLLTGHLASAEDEIHREIAELEESIASLKVRLEGIDAIKQNIATSAAEKETATTEFPLIEERIAQLEKLRDIYFSAFRVTSDLESGSSLGSIRLKDGTTIQNAVLTGFSARGIAVTSSTGPKTLAPEILPDTLRAKFTFASGAENPNSDASVLPGLFESKPTFLIPEDSNPENTAADAITATETAEPEESGGQMKEAVNEIAAIEARNKARLARVNELREKFTEVNQKKKEIIKERAAQMAEFRKSNIKKSQIEIDKAMEFFDSRIERCEKEETMLKEAIDEIRAGWE